MITGLKYLVFASMFLCSLLLGGCIEADATHPENTDDPFAVVRATRPLCTCDCAPDWSSYSETNGKSYWNRRYVTHGQVEGDGAFYITYGFKGGTVGTEKVFFQSRWNNFRPDLSFHPYGISMWIKGEKVNAGSLRFVLLHDDQMKPDNPVVRQEYATVVKDALRNTEWTRVLFKYEDFEPVGENLPAMDLSKVIGFRFEFVNDEKSESAGNQVWIDNIEQLTLYEPQYDKDAKFSSIFVQLYEGYATTDWNTIFKDYLSVGIKEVILQYATGYDTASNCTWYSDSKLSWVTQCVPVIDNMMAAAEDTGMNVRLGMYGGEYTMGYETILERNKLVANELNEKFGSSPAFTGWYITEEFYDGVYQWHQPAKRQELSAYIQTVASYAKSLKNVDVAVAPALWRGLPAKLCGKWFEAVFRETPDVDILYLQDCAGRGPDIITDVDVDLPNWYAEIKKACDATGVKFGVDIESFMSCGSPKIPYQAKTWEELSKQLYLAGLYTDYITNFSYATFKLETQSYKDYKASLNIQSAE